MADRELRAGDGRLVIAVWNTPASWNKIRVPPPKNSLFSARSFFSQNMLVRNWASKSLSAASMPNRGSVSAIAGSHVVRVASGASHHGAAQVAQHLRVLQRDLDHFLQREVPVFGILRVQERHTAAARPATRRPLLSVQGDSAGYSIVVATSSKYVVRARPANLVLLPHWQPLGAAIDAANTSTSDLSKAIHAVPYRASRSPRDGRSTRGRSGVAVISAHHAPTRRDSLESATRSGAHRSRGIGR